ncbi:hypothetical protein KL937_005080 [Ogataea polymorpha]|nr:hypothetical protein KL937_005080 [Ogataea polymorpha]KAG7931384.1 hypothetical protein KL904_005079 [Ogataea polymorpha]
MTSYRKVFSSISALPIGENSADTIISSLSSSSSGPELSESPSAKAKMRANRKEERSIQSSVLAPIEPYLDGQEKKTTATSSTNQSISVASTLQGVKNTETSGQPKIRKEGRKRRVVDSDDETPRKQQFDPNEVHCMGTTSQPDLSATITDEFSLDPIITSSYIEEDSECMRRSQSPRSRPGDLTIQTEEDTTLVSNNNLKSVDQDQLTGTLSSFLIRLRQMETFVVKRQRHIHQELEASELDRKQLVYIISQTQEILGGLMPDKAQTKAQQKNISKCMHLGP